MFRTQDSTPSVYTNQSRDFQLFGRLLDVINNGVKYDIDSMLNILDPMEVNDVMLPLMCLKVGFFPKRSYDSNILRHIVSTFPYAIKYKGTRKGIEIAVSAVLKAEGDYKSLSENISKNVMIDTTNHIITIYTTVPVIDTNALEDYLSYILPIGYSYELGTYVPVYKDSIIKASQYWIDLMINPSVSNSQTRGTDRYLKDGTVFQFEKEIEDKYIGSYNSSEIIGSDNYISKDKYTADVKKTNRDEIDRHSEITKLVSKEIKNEN